MTELVSLPRPDDFHLHLRRGPATAAYAARSAASFGRALVMPNTVPAIDAPEAIREYRNELLAATRGAGFVPLMAFKLRPGLGAAGVLACAAAGAVAGKYYPSGSTTNAEDGIADPSDVEAELRAMEEAGLVLSVHGEDPGAPALEREAAFLPVVERIIARRRRLRVVLEHLSTREALGFVRGGPDRLAGTVTAHHLALCLEDLLGGALDPHVFCKPVLKPAPHRDALRDAVLSSAPRIFFGSDSAPHPRAAKEGRRAAAGIYSSPTALCFLAGLFGGEGRLDALREFVAGAGARFYGLAPPEGRIDLARAEWEVPEELDGAVPLLAGRRLAWRIADG